MIKPSLKGLTKIGKTSFGLVLPKKILEKLNIKDNDVVIIYEKDEQIIIKKYKGENFL